MRLFILSILIILSGCATPYQQMGFFGGVDAVPVTNDVIRITVRGNANTGAATVQDYVLLKAAEVTKQRGCTHFAIISVQNASTSSAVSSGGYNAMIGMNTPIQTDVIVKPGQDAMVRILPVSASPQEKAAAIDAEQIIANIGSRVKRDGPVMPSLVILPG